MPRTCPNCRQANPNEAAYCYHDGTPFEAGGDGSALVRVVGRRLRAYHDAQEAEVRLESSGGPFAVVVRVLVSVRPFPEGALAGAMSPCELASKAKATPQEAPERVTLGAWPNDRLRVQDRKTPLRSGDLIRVGKAPLRFGERPRRTN